MSSPPEASARIVCLSGLAYASGYDWLASDPGQEQRCDVSVGCRRVEDRATAVHGAVQLLLIIAAARLFATLFRWLRAAGRGRRNRGRTLSSARRVSGYFFPRRSRPIFDPAVSDVFGVLSQLGLILLLFVVGLEFDFSHLRLARPGGRWRISLTGIALPLRAGRRPGAGSCIRYLEDVPAEQADAAWCGFVLFMGIAMSITAIPVLGRLMMELNITRTQIGAVTISAAAVDDACGWILLATVSSIVQAQFEIWLTLRMMATTSASSCVMLFVVRPLLKRLRAGGRSNGDGGELGMNSLAVVYGIAVLCAPWPRA